MPGVDRTKLKPGVRVIYHSWEGGPGKEYTVSSEPYEIHPGHWAIHLKGRKGCVGVDFISKILEDEQ